MNPSLLLAAAGLSATLLSAPVQAVVGERGSAVRAALAAEPRNGRLCIFMPPVAELEDSYNFV